MKQINITQEYFEDLKDSVETSINFISTLKNDRSFCSVVLDHNEANETGFKSAGDLINYFFIIDTARCFQLVSDITNFETKESFGLLFLQANLLGLKIDTYDQLQILIRSNNFEVFDHLKSIINQLEKEIRKSKIEDHDFLKLAYILNYHDANLRQIYLKNIYQFTSLIIKLDGTVSDYEEYVLKNIIRRKYSDDTSQRSYENNMEDNKVMNIPISPNVTSQSLEDVLNELNSLTGLNNVKAEITTLVNFIQIQKKRESMGLKVTSISYHLVFTGNPGTGKTTIARIIAKIYKCLGVLSNGQLIETDRSGLVAEYLGQTAVKTNKIIDSALNGILFIDEAYSLVGKNNDSYGEEAISTLIKRMEDDRDRLIVIVAGYTDDMKEFIESNPGFQSRFNRYVEFADYSPEELCLIFESQCKKLENNLTWEAKTKLSQLFSQAFKNRNKSFGNGRFVRNIFEKTLEKQANRIAGINNINKSILTTIEAEDVP